MSSPTTPVALPEVENGTVFVLLLVKSDRPVHVLTADEEFDRIVFDKWRLHIGSLPRDLAGSKVGAPIIGSAGIVRSASTTARQRKGQGDTVLGLTVTTTTTTSTTTTTHS